MEAIDPSPFNNQQSGRRELAEKLLADNNPLTRRVIVNRIWHHLFGRGIVGTPDNFGRMGLEPTYPELLDHLANKLQRDGWSLKNLIRYIVRSEAWQQSSRPSAKASEQDPQNQWLSHANVRRLEAEAIRDSIFAVSGGLENRLYGPPINVDQPRRSVYMRVIRNSLDPFLRVFDFPEPFSSTGRRDATNVPAQSLTLMNDPLIRRHAATWARNSLSQPDIDQRANQMFLAAFGRPASSMEIDHVRRNLQQSPQRLAQYTKQADPLNAAISKLDQQLASIMTPVRSRLLKQQDSDARPVPEPTSSWAFSQGLKDLVGNSDCRLERGATISDAGLDLGGGFATTGPLPMNVREKTLEAWVQLSELGQRGGGVMTIQTSNGNVFDSIVFSELDARQWIAGSDHHRRTKSFAAPQETEADKSMVHVAIVHHADGRVTGYRNGKQYGSEYRNDGIIDFKAGDAVISFGVRHFPAGGNRLLNGRILKANFYTRALTADEVARSSGGVAFVSDQDVLAELSSSQHENVKRLREERRQLQFKLESLGPAPPANEHQQWQDISQALFTLKEFIYIR